MHRKELLEQLKALSKGQSTGEEFSVIPLAGVAHKIGISVEGYPKFFIYTNDTASQTKNTTLEILSVEYNLSCTFIDDDNKSLPHQYTVVTLRSLDKILQSEFVDIVLLMLQRLPDIPSKRDIAIEVENLISIFSAMTCPPRKQIQGLWAELLVIERSMVPEIVIKAWHESPSSKYDFTLGRDKVEVKSTSGEERKHHFSLDQLNPSRTSRLLIASIIVRESGPGNGGMSVLDLFDKICEKSVSIEARIHMHQVIVETIGSDLHKLENVYFDYVEASDTLRFYDANDVPGINKEEIMHGVSSVGFTSDLTGIVDVQSVESAFSVTDSPLFNSLF